MHVASHIEVARLLIDSGADINAPGWMGGHPLHTAASAGHSETVKLLLEAGAEVDARQENGYTPLHFAANADVAQLLIEYGSDIHALNRFRQTPLHTTVKVAKIVEMLLMLGARVDDRDDFGKTPLHAAAAHGNVESAQLLLAAGANLDDQTTNYGYTPLHEAVWNGHTTMVQLLLTHGAQQEIRNQGGETPLHMAHSRKNPDILTLLEAAQKEEIPATRVMADSEAFLARRIILHPLTQEALAIGKEATLARWNLGEALSRTLAVQLDIPYISDAAIFPAGNIIALATKENAIELRRWDDLQRITKLDASIQDGLATVCFSPDGRWLAAADGVEQVFLIEYETGRTVAVIEGGERTGSVVFDPSSRLLASACSFQGGGHVRVDTVDDGVVTPLHELDRSNYKTPGELFVDTLCSLAFSSDGTSLALFETSAIYRERRPAGWCGNLVLFDVASGAVRWQKSIDAELTHDVDAMRNYGMGFCTEVVFLSPDEVVCGATGGAALCFDVTSGSLTRRISLHPSAAIVSLAFDPARSILYAVLETGELARATP